ncbi:cytochrome P450 [Bradyrhizobium sp. INPA01-394B]|jgi:cytochrome P450|uniref:Cytochrome P450 n=1 Tax=Bradyrhizobium campsiandrae TaxID=1729892 RepID=A0ABR7U6D3_9BRAD|nr:cytochrome P450 [Bradyrhizobium campsiandrae]MBC9880048.1 cytochrome P450 [Bradyrhizobium campsiandrae]MBC9978987.1 cytochrome P450 [Bradyrhizobium campsiandrae]
MNIRPPVEDWATDFDHLDPRWIEDPFPIWAELRSSCPVAHTDRFQGVYLPTRYKDIREIAYHTEAFSSRRVQVRATPPPVKSPAPPITSDPPHHRLARMVLLLPFTPAAIDKLIPGTRAICNELIDRFAGKNQCDAALDYAQHIPVLVIARMLGLPADQGEKFRDWVHGLVEAAVLDDEAMVGTLEEMTAYFLEQVQRRRKTPSEDLISYLVAARVDVQPLTDNHILGTLRLLLIAGIDTTWSGIGACLWHLARTPEDRRRLASDPALMPTAIEELLRAYSPVTMARMVTKDTVVEGCPYKAGQMVLLSFPAANRDPAMFPDADKVIIDRKENRHAAFGLGIHRCIGSNLARMELTVAVEEFLKRVPEFHLADPKAVRWSEGAVRGPPRAALEV